MIWRAAFVALSLVATIGILAVAIVGAGVGPVDLLLALPPSAHVAALGAAALSMGGRALRMRIVCRALGEPLPFATALGAQLVGDAAGLATPARLGSEAGKILVVHRAGVSLVTGAAVNMAEVLCEAGTLVVLVGVTLLVVPGGEALPLIGALSYAVAIAATQAGSLVLARLPGEHPPRFWTRVGLRGERWSTVHEAAGRFLAHAVRLSRLPVRSILLLFVVSAVNIVARLAVLPALALSSAASGAWSLVVWPALLLYGGALVPVPGGGGTIELGFMAALGAAFTPATLVATLFWWRIYTLYLAAALGGLVLVPALRVGRGRKRAASGARVAEGASASEAAEIVEGASAR